MKLAAILVGCMLAGVAPAQPQGEQPPGPQDRPREIDPEAMRTRLERRLAENQRVEALIKAALDKLAKGENPDEILRELEPAGRFPGRGEGGGRPDGMRRPDFDPEGPGPGRQQRERGGGGGEGWGRMQPGQPIPEAERERVMEFLRTNLPLIAEKFARLQEVDPDGADRMLARLVPRLREAQRVGQSDPALARLRLQELKTGINVLESVRELRRVQDMPADAEDRESKLENAKRELRERLVEQGEARMQLQAHEIEVLTTRLEGLRNELERKHAGRDQSVDEMLQRIVESRENPPGEHPEPRKRPD